MTTTQTFRPEFASILDAEELGGQLEQIAGLLDAMGSPQAAFIREAVSRLGFAQAGRRMMMEAIRAAYYGGNRAVVGAIWELQDGYGVAGATPEQGWDWSGIRDSSPAAVFEMFEFVQSVGRARG